MPGPSILHSVYGRMFGLDNFGFTVSKDNDVVAATSATTGTDILPGGITTLSSAATVWRIDPPVPGLKKIITSLSTSTANRAVSCQSGTIQSSGAANYTSMIFQGLNYNVELVGLSTALWGVVSAQNAIFNTSTST